MKGSGVIGGMSARSLLRGSNAGSGAKTAGSSGILGMIGAGANEIRQRGIGGRREQRAVDVEKTEEKKGEKREEKSRGRSAEKSQGETAGKSRGRSGETTGAQIGGRTGERTVPGKMRGIDVMSGGRIGSEKSIEITKITGITRMSEVEIAGQTIGRETDGPRETGDPREVNVEMSEEMIEWRGQECAQLSSVIVGGHRPHKLATGHPR